ncbi:hypothetical protein [Leuconostoc citreum]|uniref:hypothetical protein n=1 Tax=Leuconostoc citreum TaxID=33964 RepID=UPI002073F02B|nr:hypothetical protein [Leuconostoc citreum]
MTFDEAIEQMEELQGSAGYATYGVPEANNFSGYDVHEYLNAANEIINNLRKEYAPTVEMTQEQYQQFINFRKRTDSVQTHAVTLHDKKTKYPEFLNDLVGGVYGRLFLQAWLHPETIKVIGENNDTATSGRNKD